MWQHQKSVFCWRHLIELRVKVTDGGLQPVSFLRHLLQFRLTILQLVLCLLILCQLLLQLRDLKPSALTRMLEKLEVLTHYINARVLDLFLPHTMLVPAL